MDHKVFYLYMNITDFNKLHLNQRFSLILYSGQHLSTIKLQDFKASLYAMEGSYVEVYHNTITNDIEEITTLRGTEPRLNLYATAVNLSHLYLRD